MVHSSTSSRAARRRGAELAAHPLGAQLNRRQRVLDLVGQPPRHVAPGGDPLRPDERRHVVEHQHRAGERPSSPDERRRGGGQVQLAPFAGQRELLRPAAARRAAAGLAQQRLERLEIVAREQRVGRRDPITDASTSSSRSAALLIVSIRPSAPIETTPVAIRSSTVSM